MNGAEAFRIARFLFAIRESGRRRRTDRRFRNRPFPAEKRSRMQAPQSRGFVKVDFLLNLKAFNPNNLVMKKLWLLPLLTAALI